MSEKINAITSTQSTSRTSKTNNAEKFKGKQNIDMSGPAGSSSSAGKGTNVSSGQFPAETKELVDQFYNAVYGIGTDEKAMTEALSKIDKDNVIDVMRCWNKYHSNESGESFMEAFMWGCRT